MTDDAIEDMFSGLDRFYPGSKRVRKNIDKPKKVIQDKENWDANSQLKKLPNGTTIELFPAGSLSAALGRPLVTIRLWERKGYIPRAPYRLKSALVDGKKVPGWRMYSRGMIESAIQSFQSRDLLEAPRIDWNRHPGLSVELLENWSRIHTQETMPIDLMEGEESQ